MDKIKKREAVPLNETWDLSDLFLDWQAWEKAFQGLPALEELTKTLEQKYRGKLAQSAQILFSCLQFRDELSRKLENLYVYAALRLSEDVTNSTANEAVGKVEMRMSSLLALFAFVEPEILTISSIEEWITKDPLATYAFRIQSLLRTRPHILSEKEETLLAKLSVPLKSADDVHAKWNSADLKFEDALDAQGKAHLVTQARLSLNLESVDRTLRENTFSSLYKEIGKWRNTIAANYYGNILSGSSIAKIRNFSSFLQAELFSDDIPVSLYENLIATVKKQLPLLHQSMRLRQQILNVDIVQPYDRYVSLYTPQNPLRFSWEEGRDLVLEAIKPLGEEYVAKAKAGLTQERWIDRAENEGKRTGAFSWGTYDSRPYMLQTWKGTLGDVFTLAHELGHSMHSFYSHKHQPYHNASYSIFVAEVASTLNEALLSHHILNTMPESELAKVVLGENLKNFEGTVLRQVLFAAFEQQAAHLVDAGEVLTADVLENFYLSLNREWYGEGSETIRFEWMRIPHFYSNFYVYKYATSFCASLALKEKLISSPQEGHRAIFALLQAGGSKSPLSILKDSGVDLLSAAPIEKAFENYAHNLQKAEVMLRK